MSRFIFGLGCLAMALFFVSKQVQAATLSASPVAGSFTVGSTFDVAVNLNTEKESINVIEASLFFPPDKLQLVSPSTGKSIIGVWTSQPSADNQTGKIRMQGGIPGGINVSSGLITTLTFRVKSVGTATLKFLDDSKVLRHDGRGTNVLFNTTNGVYQLILPPPGGPVVVSETHPDQTIWHKSPNVSLSWSAEEQVSGYSFELSDDPTSIPDDIVDSEKNSITYRNLTNGVHYFHIKGLREGNFGGTTHFALKVDSAMPANFPIKVIPSARTTRQQPIFEFSTTDSDSGVGHYEIKLFSVSKKSGQQPLFIETTSPYVPEELPLGDYTAIVRAYDNAGNFREVVKKFSIVSSSLYLIGEDGLQIFGDINVPWSLFWAASVLILLIIILLAYKIRKKHKEIEGRRESQVLPENLKQQLDDLQKYKQKYGLLILFLAFSAGLIPVKTLFAEQLLSTPAILEISSSISNKEIFYIGGRVDDPQSEVQVYLQNKDTEETFSFTVKPDKKGEWFYKHDSFLSTGRYSIWVQGKLLGQVSAPSSQNEIVVQRRAWEIGSSRLSYEFIYLCLVAFFFLAFLIVLVYLLYQAFHLRKKKKLFSMELRAAEESIKRGFAIIRRDVQTELMLLKDSKNNGSLTQIQIQQEARLMQDLEDLEERLGREIWQIEQEEQNM